MIEGVDRPPHPTIFLNEKIKTRENGPVIRVVYQDGRSAEGNRVLINGPSVVLFNVDGNPHITTHHVQAWLECWTDDIKVN